MPTPSFVRYFKTFGDMLADAVPTWRANRLGQNVGFRFEWAMVLPLSIWVEWAFQGVNAWAPGSPNATPDALPLVGQTRGLTQGEAESNDAYAARLRNWIGPAPFTEEIWANMGQSELFVQALQTYLADNPKVTLIERTYPMTVVGPITASGTSPPGVTLTIVPKADGTPVDRFTKIRISIRVAGVLGAALFEWSINGQGETVGGFVVVKLPASQQEIPTAQAILLGTTGLVANFPGGAAFYSADNEWVSSTALPATLEAIWVTANLDGTTSKVVAPWDWDSKSGFVDGAGEHAGAEVEQWWSDLWLVVTPRDTMFPEWEQTGPTLSYLVPIWGNPQGVGLGHAIPRKTIDDVLALVAQYKGAHTFVRAIIWNYDGTKFQPGSPTADGTFGNWSKNDGFGNLIVAREPSARYCLPENG